MFWKDKRALVTGGAGFVGSHVAGRLCELGARVTVADADRRRVDGLLRRLPGTARALVGDLSESGAADAATRDQQIVFHLASRMAGLRYNKAHPAEMLVDNTLLDLQVLKWCACNRVEGTLYCSGALVYDIERPSPTPEDAGTDGAANPDCEGSVWAKRMGERAAGCYGRECAANIIIARLANVYGPGDDFALETAHLIGNVIRSVSSGAAPEIHGDGAQLRSYLYVSDAVDALLALVETGAYGETVNVCGRYEVTVAEVVTTILEAMQSPVEARRAAGPTGAGRRLLDVRKLARLTGFRERVLFREGIRRTVEWYLQNREEPSAGVSAARSPRGRRANRRRALPARG